MKPNNVEKSADNLNPSEGLSKKQEVSPTVSDLMNIRRKSMALTAEIEKILGFKPNPPHSKRKAFKP
jgi:hypothetical protein